MFEGQIYNRTEERVLTVGFIPEEYRTRRLKLAEKFSDRICGIGVKSITSHVGAVPNDPKSPLYLEFVPAMRKFIEYCQRNG